MWIERWDYKIVSVQPGDEEDLEIFDNALREFWEPYAVSWNGVIFHHHLRKMITYKEKK